MKVKSIGSNQTEIYAGDTIVLISYETPVACHVQGEGFYRTSRKWSRTTSKHITLWLNSHGGATAEEKPQEFFDNLLA